MVEDYPHPCYPFHQAGRKQYLFGVQSSETFQDGRELIIADGHTHNMPLL